MDITEYLEYNSETGNLVWKKKSSRKTIVGSVAGTVNTDGYVVVTFNSKKYLGHRLCWYLYYGDWPKSDIDHEDRNRSNNKIDNIRLASSRQNQQNTERFNEGCYKQKDDGKWRARIFLKGKRISLGSYSSLEKAQEAYKQKVLELND